MNNILINCPIASKKKNHFCGRINLISSLEVVSCLAMNEKILSIISTMFSTLPASKELVGARQIYFKTETHECSITVFQPQDEDERKDMETSKRFAKNDNDIVWLENVRFSATAKI